MYLADVAGSVSGILSIGGVCAIIGCAVYRVIKGIADTDSYGEKSPPAPVKNYLIASAIALAVASLIPSKTTIYAAAAVAAGEKALATPTGDKAVRALNAWLDRQIADEGKSK
jgi:hypothetical protein